jgi:hypothetical protein
LIHKIRQIMLIFPTFKEYNLKWSKVLSRSHIRMNKVQNMSIDNFLGKLHARVKKKEDKLLKK